MCPRMLSAWVWLTGRETMLHTALVFKLSPSLFSSQKAMYLCVDPLCVCIVCLRVFALTQLM